MKALNGETMDWPYKFYQELKDELVDLSKKAQGDEPKVVKSAIGPHITLLLYDAEKLDGYQATQTGFGANMALELSEQLP